MVPTVARIEPNNETDKLLLDTFTNALKQGFVQIGPENICMPLIYNNYAEQIENFEVYDDDIWLISHPKCGTTWAQEMVWLIGNNLNYKKANEEALVKRFPFLELCCIYDYSNVCKKQPDFSPPVGVVDSIRITKNQPRPRFIKSHLPFSILPKQIRENIRKPKIIYVARNLKDTCSSYFNHCRMLEGYNGNYEQFSQLFLNGRINYGPFTKNVLGFWNRRNQSNIIFIKYEDMKRDLASVIKQTSEFLGKTVPEQAMSELLHFLSIDVMKTKEGIIYNIFSHINRQFYTNNVNSSFFMSGTEGCKREKLIPEIEAKLDEVWGKISKETGLTF